MTNDQRHELLIKAKGEAMDTFQAAANAASFYAKPDLYPRYFDKALQHATLAVEILRRIERDEPINTGCDFCNNFDFGNAAAQVSKCGITIQAGISLAGGSAKLPKDKQFNYCPVCGRSLND